MNNEAKKKPEKPKPTACGMDLLESYNHRQGFDNRKIRQPYGGKDK